MTKYLTAEISDAVDYAVAGCFLQPVIEVIEYL